MKPKEIIDIALSLHAAVWPDTQKANKYSKWLGDRAIRLERKLDDNLCDNLDSLTADIEMVHFVIGFLVGQMFTVVDPDLTKRLRKVKREFCREEIVIFSATGKKEERDHEHKGEKRNSKGLS
jgi:hypothetical protein